MNEWCFNSSKNIHYFIPAITYKTRAPSVQSVNSQMLYVILIHKRVGKKKRGTKNWFSLLPWIKYDSNERINFFFASYESFEIGIQKITVCGRHFFLS